MFRFFYIIFLLARYLILVFLPFSHIGKLQKPQLLKKFLEDAGGAFIKFGQLLALRVDILPKEYFLELINLYDNVKPFPYPEVEQIINYELGATPDKVFSYFEKKPFASASFGQVHAAKLKDESVIVKVQRPQIRSTIGVDFCIIDILSFFADLFFKIEALPWKEFAREFKMWTLKELDYQIEAENAQKIYDNTAKNKNLNIVIPKTYHRFTTKKVLVQEYIDGIPLSRLLRGLKDGRLTPKQLMNMGINIRKVPVTLVTELMREYFFDGFFHADPHPGNILLLEDDKIALIDFGIVGEAAPKRESFMKFVLAGAESKYDKVGYHFLEFAGDSLKQMIGSVLPVNIEQSYLDNFYQLLAGHFADTAKDIEMTMKKDLEVMKIDYTVMFIQMLKYAARYRIKLPKQMIVFIRALSIIGFLGKELDYKFYLTDIILNFCKKYPINSIPRTYVAESLYKRLNREEALDLLNDWFAYLMEIDPKLYQLVNNYISKYNEVS